MSAATGPVPLRAVVFDFYGTLAWHGSAPVSPYADVFTRHGYRLDEAVEAEYFARYDGVEHFEHSESEAVYEAWVRQRHHALVRSCRVHDDDVDRVVEALRTQDTAPVVAYPDAAETLGALRDRGFSLGVCSNWGWNLDASLEQAGLLHVFDAAVTSAQVGVRKPHRQIYGAITDALGVSPDETLFVGDSLDPDVAGPLALGMRAVHVWRAAGGTERPPPALPPGATRVATVAQVLDLPLLARAGPPGPSGRGALSVRAARGTIELP